jgi:TolA-binding protein
MNKQSQVRPDVSGLTAWPAKMTAAGLVAACAVGLAACSSGTSTSSSSHTAAPRTTSPSASPANTGSGSAMANQAMCKHVNSLRGSLESLAHLQLNASSASQIRTNLTNAQTQLSALKSQGGGAFSHQVNELSGSLNKVKKAAGNLSSPPSASQVNAVVTALTGLRAQSKTTVAQMNAACPKG